MISRSEILALIEAFPPRTDGLAPWLVMEDELTDTLSAGPDRDGPVAWAELEAVLDSMVLLGAIGRSYIGWDFSEGEGWSVGRRYFVWRRTPGTEEFDRDMMAIDAEEAELLEQAARRGRENL